MRPPVGARQLGLLWSIGLVIALAIATSALLYSVISTALYQPPIVNTNQTVTEWLSINHIQCNGPPLPNTCLPDFVGDVVGSVDDLTVTGLQTFPLSDVPPLTGQLLIFNGTAWIPTTLNSLLITSSPGSNIMIDQMGDTIYVATTQSVVIETLAVSQSTLLGTNTSCIAPLLPSCYDISAQSCTTPLAASCVPLDLTINNLMVYNLTLFNATTLDVPIGNQTVIYTDYLFVQQQQFLNGPLTCPNDGNGFIDNGCLHLGNYSCPLGSPLAESCIPASLVQYDQTVTNQLTVNLVSCTGPPLPLSCLPDFAGDVTGTLGANTVEALQGTAISSVIPTTDQYLVYNGSEWTPTTVSLTLGGDVTGPIGANTVTALQGTAISAVAPTIDQYLIYNGSEWIPTTVSLTLGGDVTGPIGSNTVVKIQGQTVAVTTPTDGQVLAWDTVVPGWRPQGNPVYYGTGTQTNSGTNTVTIGPSSTTAGATDSVAIGNTATARAIDSIAIGRTSTTSTTGTNAIAIGKGASANSGSAIAIGNGVVANAPSAVAIGTTPTAAATSSVAIGNNAVANAISSVAIGVSTTCSTTGTSSVAIGNTASATGTSGTALGKSTIANAANALAVGQGATCSNTGTSSVAAGSLASATGTNAVAVGPSASCTGASGIAIGLNAAATGGGAVSIGSGATGIGYALGVNAASTGIASLSIGSNSASTNTNTIAIGSSAFAITGASCIAFGTSSLANAADAIAIGRSSIANIANGIAIGQAATTNSIASAISLGAGASPLSTANSFALAINAASVLPGTMGITLNGAARVLDAYTSLYTTTAGAGPTVLSATSSKIQWFTTAQTVTLPDVSTLQLGFSFEIINNSGGNLVVQSSGGNTKITLLTNTWAKLVCILTTGTTDASWGALSGGAVS